jgi:hypothetical protein
MKEAVLACLALLWGVLFILPGNSIGITSRFNLLSFYAEDWVWGILLCAGSLFILIFPRSKYLQIRRWIHFFFWAFWLGISILVLVRSSVNGLGITDILISSLPFTLAFLHATLYARLAQTK